MLQSEAGGLYLRICPLLDEMPSYTPVPSYCCCLIFVSACLLWQAACLACAALSLLLAAGRNCLPACCRFRWPPSPLHVITTVFAYMHSFFCYVFRFLGLCCLRCMTAYAVLSGVLHNTATVPLPTAHLQHFAARGLLST